MENSHSKIKAIFEIVDGLDDLDKEAWMELINKAEKLREKEIAENASTEIKDSHKVFSAVLPLVRLARLMIASEDISSFQRTVIVNPLIQELLWLLSPVQAAGVLTSLIYTNFDKGKPQVMPVMIVPQQGLRQEKEDNSRLVV